MNISKSKTVKKGLSPQAKRNIANIFGSLISNQRAIDGAKELPIWVAIIFLILSVFLPVIPMMVNTSKGYGSAFIDSYSYNLDKTLSEATHKMQIDGYVYTVVDSGNNTKELTINPEKKPVSSTDPVFEYINSTSSEYNLLVYYSDGDNAALTSLKEYCISTKYISGTTIEVEGETTETTYIPSTIILHKDHIYFYVFKEGTTTGITSTYEGCNWNNYTGDTNLLTRVTKDTGTLYDTNRAEYYKKVFGEWKVVLDESYIQQKGYTLLTSTFIYLGIFLGLVIFMGLLIFLLTRGKKNIFRYLSFITCEKIAAWASLAPGLLGLILGFIFPSQAILFFIMILGVRIMWLSMKQLRPQNY